MTHTNKYRAVNNNVLVYFIFGIGMYSVPFAHTGFIQDTSFPHNCGQLNVATTMDPYEFSSIYTTFSLSPLKYVNGTSEGNDILNLPSNITEIYGLESHSKCHVTICDSLFLNGFCVQIPPGSKMDNLTKLQSILERNPPKSYLCVCSSDDSEGTSFPVDPRFNRNSVGVVYSPFDKNVTVIPTGSSHILQTNYTLDDLRGSLSIACTKFTHLSTYDMGSLENTSDWESGTITAYIPQAVAEVNVKLGYLFARLAVGIQYNELKNGIAAAKFANGIFPGSVWGITVTKLVVASEIDANDILDKIRYLRKLNSEQDLRLKIGVRIRIQENPVGQQQLWIHNIAMNADYIIFTHNLQERTKFSSLQAKIIFKQRQYTDLRNELQSVNSKMKFIIGTGIPSVGETNGLPNSVESQRDYWYNMSDFGEQQNILFHMYEAIDQPMKGRSDAHEGWWRRVDDSYPPVYIEKITEIETIGLPEVGKDGDEKQNNFVLIIAVGMSSVFVVVLAASAFYFWRRYQKSKINILNELYVEQFHNGGDVQNIAPGDANYAVAFRIPYDKKYELSKNDFFIDKSFVIGSGQSATVVRGSITNYNQPVAFKCTTPNNSIIDIKNLLSEIKILSYIGKHNNIVCILGAYTKKVQRGIVYAALEYCEMGSLETFLRMGKHSTECLKQANTEYLKIAPMRNHASYLTTVDLQFIEQIDEAKESKIEELKMSHFNLWSYQIASAMEFVSEKKVCHADLATRNILLASLDHVKISDFGLSRKLYTHVDVKHDKDTPLPWRWMPPEALRQLQFSVESDVWSFGITVWEILSLGQVPYHGRGYDEQFLEELEHGYRLPLAKFGSHEIHNQLLKCWNISPNQRPNFTQLKNFFETLIN